MDDGTRSNYTPLPQPVAITRQSWDTDTVPLVSILCLTYNHEHFIKECLEGFLMQETTFPVEIIVHDDASTDQTAGVIREYERSHPRLFRTILQTENQYSRGRKALQCFLFPAARGKYFAICEGDDYWIDARKIQKQKEVIEADESVSMVRTAQKNLANGAFLDDSGTGGTRTFFFRRDVACNSLDFQNKYARHIFFGDVWLHNQAKLLGRIVDLPDVTAVWRKHDGGVWSNLVDNDTVELDFLRASTKFWIGSYFATTGAEKRAVSRIAAASLKLATADPRLEQRVRRKLLLELLRPRLLRAFRNRRVRKDT